MSVSRVESFRSIYSLFVEREGIVSGLFVIFFFVYGGLLGIYIW